MKSVLRKKGVFAILAALFVVSSVFGRENVPDTGNSGSGGGDHQRLSNANKVMTGCQQGTTQTEIKLNNVRTRILTCGDMWWDVNSNPKYEVPKGSGSYACFAGSLWFGGYVNNQLRISAMTYRQNGIDFWPGPLDPATADVDAATCTAYDKHWRFNRAEVDEFYNKYAAATAGNPAATLDPSYSMPAWIRDYPGSAPTNYDSLNDNLFNYLAPFTDVNDNHIYEPDQGDYPRYNVTSEKVGQGNCKHYLFGDETLFWVFNDKGNNHTESGSVASIGVEIRAQGFEFATSDVLNDMTFYNFEIINRSTNRLDSTYFAVWVDADLGYYNDDYVGCDVVRGLGYIYNGDNNDENGNGVIGYGQKLPALGCDFFQGPNADVGDGIDNDRDSCVDCTFYITDAGVTRTDSIIPDYVLPEPISMSKFVPYNNDFNAKTGNPTTTGNGIQYYRYMTGSWKDGTLMRYDGHTGTDLTTTYPQCAYLYPGDSDPLGYGIGGSPSNPIPAAQHPVWTENTAANSPGDRRFLQSAGEFTLDPGAVNIITFGMPFVRTNSAYNFAAIPLLLIADDKAQSLFDNCFKVLDGPDAPDMTIQEMENQLIMYFSNKETSNNYEQHRYAEFDPTIASLTSSPSDKTDKVYRFEGYMVFQLKDASVSAADIYDENKSRLVFQCDKKNGVGDLINYNTDPTLGNVPQLMTPEANDAGIVNSFVINEDKFAEGNKTLVNHKTYYFLTIAYAYNNYLPYKQDVAPGTDTLTGNQVHLASGDYTGQKKPFLQGRRNVKVYSAIPHNISPEAGGTVINSSYGYGPKVTRVEGQGNGGRVLDLTSASVNSILASPTGIAQNIEYENNRGPIGVKVIDPLKVLSGNFTVKMKKVIPGLSKDSLIVPDPADLDSGKVKGTYKYEISGTYTNSSGASVSKTWNSDEVIALGQEFILIGEGDEPIGISVTVGQDIDPKASLYFQNGLYGPNTVNADLLESSMNFSSADTKWLTSVVDLEGPVEQNWIRSGISAGSGSYDEDSQMKGVTGLGTKTYFADPEQVWENVVGGTWAPFRFTAKFNPNVPGEVMFGPSIGYPTTGSGTAFSKYNNRESNTSLLSSVDVVFTNDRSKWTRCVVLEMGANTATNIGNQRRFLPRKSKSVDKNGDTTTVGGGIDNCDYISPTGMGWFPGYAINVETGERLNLAFGENSSMVSENGADMIWNPTSHTYMPGSNTNLSFGGQHYIYIFGHNSDGMSGTTPIDVPRYDAGAKLFTMLNQTFGNTNNAFSNYGKTGIVEAYKDAMWVNIPLIRSSYTGNFPAYRAPTIPCDAKVRIRVRKPLRYGLAGTWASSYSQGTSSGTNLGTIMLRDTLVSHITDVISATPLNFNFPMYTFNTDGLGASTNVADVASSALDIINVVPNPYYGHSQYEQTRIDNYIKIVNLPVKCTIRIYSLNGTLIRTIKKNTDATTDVSWDLKNEKNILVTSGLYIIHVDAGDAGEKILKWFCVMRPIDLQSY
jgi:hypothetical protein